MLIYNIYHKQILIPITDYTSKKKIITFKRQILYPLLYLEINSAFV